MFVLFSVTGCLERLAYMPLRGTPDPPPGVEEVWFESADGKRLHAWWMPAFRGAGMEVSPHPRPTILVAHGNAGNVSHHHAFVDFLPDAGYNVLLFDYRGYGLSDRGWLNRRNLYKDTQAALDYLLTRDDIDHDRIGVYGQSLGGTFALHLMADRPEVRAGVIVSAYTRWQDITACVLGGHTPGRFARFLGRALMPAGLDAMDAIVKIEDRPLLLVHGTADEIVPFAHAEMLLEAAQEAGVEARLAPVPGGDHNNIRWDHPAFEREIRAFLHETLSRQ